MSAGQDFSTFTSDAEGKSRSLKPVFYTDYVGI